MHYLSMKFNRKLKFDIYFYQKIYSVNEYPVIWNWFGINSHYFVIHRVCILKILYIFSLPQSWILLNSSFLFKSWDTLVLAIRLPDWRIYFCHQLHQKPSCLQFTFTSVGYLCTVQSKISTSQSSYRSSLCWG